VSARIAATVIADEQNRARLSEMKNRGDDAMKIIGVIPARYASTRFPGKPLADIHGKPMIWWVYQQAMKVSAFESVIVATDDARIHAVCGEYGMRAKMTSSEHGTSTERINEIAGSAPADFYVCINGDEPLVPPGAIEKIIPRAPAGGGEIFVSNIMTKIKSPVELIDTSNIKVVSDMNGNALFMSRSPMPYPKTTLDYDYYKHVGILCYNDKALKFFSETPKGYNEKIEDINELRYIENGVKVKMIEAEMETLSVDTPKDIEKVRRTIEWKKMGGGKT
jgi:3-deoxy-manno-octulosonate cytidylyltransferase (CMP-KDO synthetase)